jgi:hypothetical protein
MTDPAGRTTARGFGIAAVLLGGILLGSTGCGSVTAKKSDGGTGGSVVDSSTKMDVAADRKVQDARTVDASSHGGSGAGSGGAAGGSGGIGAGGTGGGGASGGKGGAGGGNSGAGGTSGGSGGASGGSGGASGSSGGAGSGGSGTGGAGGAGECKTNADCTLYTGAGSGCCGVCQPATDPAPPPIECLLACLTPLKTCGCVNNQCVGSKTQL